MSKRISKRTKRPSKAEESIGINEFDKWLDAESERTGKSKQKIVEETFKDGFITWTVEDTQAIVGEEKGSQKAISQVKMDSMIKDIERNERLHNREQKDEAIANLRSRFIVQESANMPSQAPPILTAWAMPNVAEDVDELRRLRRDFAPVSRSIDYIKSMIIGNDLDVEIEDPEDKSKKEVRNEIKLFMKNLFQDTYTRSLYTLLSIMLDEALTVGASGAEIRYENSDFKFMDFVISQESSNLPVSKSSTGGKDFIYYKSKEPDWGKLEHIVQLKIFKNALGRMKLYRDPNTWEANYWTLDEIVSTGDTAMAIPQMALKPAGGQSQRFHPWQIFWLNVNRREFDEKGMSVISGGKNLALLLERMLNSVGEGVYRAGNKKYFIICGTEKRPWSKPHIRNVMQQVQEMGRRNWTTVPVPYGFDIKSIGGEVFQANQVLTIVINLLAQAMHVPTEVLGIVLRAQGAGMGERILTASFNEIEQMRYEFKSAIQNQLFMKELWCTHGKTRTKQGGKGTEPIYVPAVKCSTKGLLSPIDRLEQIEKILNLANPVSPQTKLEVERDLADIMGYDNIDFETQDELKRRLEELTGSSSIVPNPAADKSRGPQEPPSEDKQKKRLEGGVNKKQQISTGGKGVQGGTRMPAESKVRETAPVVFDSGARKLELEGLFIDPKRIQEILDKEEREFIVQEQRIETNLGTTGSDLAPISTDRMGGSTVNKRGTDVTGHGSQKTGGNYGPSGYYTVMDIPSDLHEGVTFEIAGPIVDTHITVEVRKLNDAVARYSKDLSKIYVDPSADPEDYKPYLVHEIQEYIFEENLGMSYETAERLANEYEKVVCEELEIDWDEHQERFDKAMEVIKARKGVKNPDDVVEHKISKKSKSKKKKNVGEVGMGSSSKKDTSDSTADIKGGFQHDKGEAGQERVGGFPDRSAKIGETAQEPQRVEITIKTEPLKIEQGKSEVVILQTSKPEVEKALKELAVQQKETHKKLESVSKELNDKQDALKTLQEEQSRETKIISEEKITAEMTKINMEIVNLEAERRRIEEEIKIIQETAQQKKELMEKIEKKLEEENKEED